MNIKFSQLPQKLIIKNGDLFPLLSDGTNYMSPIDSIYTYVSANKVIQVYTAYNTTSAYLLSSAALANSVYATYSAISSNYVLLNSEKVYNWDSNYTSTNTNSSNWTQNYNYVNSISSNFIFSNPSLVSPTASAIKNIVAITQANYDGLPSIDPQTYYVIANI
jgi:hypothetical protein